MECLESSTSSWQIRGPLCNHMPGMGRLIADPFGGKVYTIAITTYEGEERQVTAGSLEAMLHNLGHTYAFLDLRSANDALRLPPVTMRRPVPTLAAPGTPGGYGFAESEDLSRIFDGVIYIDRMAPVVGIPIPNFEQ